MGLVIARSSLNYICKGVPLPENYTEKVKILNSAHLSTVRQLAIDKNKQKRQVYLDELLTKDKDIFANADLDTLKIALAMLYLGEGAKWASHRGLLLGNSNPQIVQIYVRLLEKCFNISKDQLRIRVQYRADQDINELELYWSNLLGVPRSQFYKTAPDLRTLGKPTKRGDYRGVCVIMCGGTDVQLRLTMISDRLQDYLGH